MDRHICEFVPTFPPLLSPQAPAGAWDSTSSRLLCWGEPLVAHSLAAFEACADVAAIVLVCAGERMGEFERIRRALRRLREVVAGGRERVDSVLSGVIGTRRHLSGLCRCARWGAPAHYSFRHLHLLRGGPRDRRGQAVSAEPVTDTLHRTDAAGLALETVSRENLWRMQTPQIVETGVLKALLLGARESGAAVTDEISLLLQAESEGPRGGESRLESQGDLSPRPRPSRDVADKQGHQSALSNYPHPSL